MDVKKLSMENIIESNLASGYNSQGYVSYHNEIDAGVVDEFPCDSCGSKMRYIGLTKDLGYRSSYIAISHCDNCGNEYEF